MSVVTRPAPGHQISTQLDLAASRARIVPAADETRRKIERDLHDGVQQRLVSLVLAQRTTEAIIRPELRDVAIQLAQLREELAGAMEEVQEIARGIHPAILARGGLAPALRMLCRRSAVPVELDVRIAARPPEPVEVAAYHVVSGALTNVAKHARASAVGVTGEARADVLELSIRDDGRGGAGPTRGSGIFGLSDRVDVLAGTIEMGQSSRSGDDAARHASDRTRRPAGLTLSRGRSEACKQPDRHQGDQLGTVRITRLTAEERTGVVPDDLGQRDSWNGGPQR